MSYFTRQHEPKVGDLAEHKFRELDAREVVKVDGTRIWIRIGITDAGPLPAENYVFLRRKEQQS